MPPTRTEAGVCGPAARVEDFRFWEVSLLSTKRSAAPGTRQPVTRGGDGCPVCFAQAVPKIDVGAFVLYGCPSCGAWSSDALSRGASTSFEPAAYFDNPLLDGDKWDRLLATLDRDGTALDAALDVGCGTGDFLAYLAGRWPGIRCEGIELDADRAETARQRAAGARILTGDAVEALDRAAGLFDLVTMWDVLEHVPEPTRLLTDLAGRLSPSGVIYVQTIHERSIVPAIGRWSYRLSGGRVRYPARRTHDAHHAGFFTVDCLAVAAEQAGLRIRHRWFDRLAFGRMDGSTVVRAATATLLRIENAFGGGLFVNLVLEHAAQPR
jgi:2-polyprenyl-6-hydroxyphenyl methylase/3-demethylubiquinone-9 3-methyltransferase